ncbi:MAG: aspartate 1-decarboxylase [Bifidobacteriaceae bacterium]|jgi:aspartate 1-decarboxylase|nr:aspartate 1-decarboxylase [Bifidobacteriaceae bacterium]
MPNFQRTMLLSKIHRATVTDANPDYIGSITLDPVLAQAADLLEGQQVDVLDVTNGRRLTTYVLLGRAGTGQCDINGAAARHIGVGDVVIIVAYGLMDDAAAQVHRPKVVFVDGNNAIMPPPTRASRRAMHAWS